MSDIVDSGFLDSIHELFVGIPRQGPGSDATTRRAVGLLPRLGGNSLVLDLGCGSGHQTLVLAQCVPARIEAIELSEVAISLLAARVQELNLGDRIRCRSMSISDLDYEPASVDLIWSEGAFYTVGVETALEICFPILKPGGVLAFSELVWFVDHVPDEPRRFFEQEYPDIGDEARVLDRAARAGFRSIAQFRLPAVDWWTDFYGPVRARLKELADANTILEEPAASFAAGMETEMRLHEEHSDSYGYTFFLFEKP